jgi:D-glycero-D-manno-heptose 1,7-bisphosphate phosphatase
VARRRFVLLDRDGTIIVERDHLSSLEQVELLPGAADGLRRLRQLGLGLIAVSNQSVIGRGLIDETQLDAIHRRLHELLKAEGVVLDAIYVCPHRPDAGCDCRKPMTGLVQRAAREYDFDPADSFVVGDKECDIELGRRVGAATILVRTGYGATEELRPGVKPDYVEDDLRAAAVRIEQLLNGKEETG